MSSDARRGRARTSLPRIAADAEEDAEESPVRPAALNASRSRAATARQAPLDAAALIRAEAREAMRAKGQEGMFGESPSSGPDSP